LEWLLKLAGKCARNNKIKFGINKCDSLVVWGKVSRFLNNNNPTSYLSSQELPKTNWYTLLRCTVFKWFRNWKLIIQRMNNKVRKALYSIKGLLKNPPIPIPYKRMLFSAIGIWQVSYYAPLLASIKERTRSYKDTS